MYKQSVIIVLVTTKKYKRDKIRLNFKSSKALLNKAAGSFLNTKLKCSWQFRNNPQGILISIAMSHWQVRGARHWTVQKRTIDARWNAERTHVWIPRRWQLTSVLSLNVIYLNSNVTLFCVYMCVKGQTFKCLYLNYAASL